MRLRTRFVRFLCSGLIAGLSFASAASSQERVEEPSAATKDLSARLRLTNYTLGPGDEISIMSINAEEISNRPVRITSAGDINLPMVGRVFAAGLRIEQLEAILTERLKTYIREPNVVVNVVKFNSQPVSVLGAVGRPGIIQLEGQKTLVEVLSLAGGVTGDAGSRIKITRRNEWGLIPLASATAEGEYSVAELDYLSIMDASRPESNIQILPQDLISVPRAQLIYVIGEVRTPGGFVLNGKTSISLIEALARAGGLQPTSQGKESKIIRPVPGASRIEIQVNLTAVLAGKTPDVMLQPEDILYVPTSYAKGAIRKTLDQIIGTTLGIAIYRL